MDCQENCYKRGTLPSKTYSRVEQYLRELCLLEDAPLPIPQSRIELLLEAIFTGDISKCESPKSREEKLIWALLTGDESDIEKCASRIEVLWYCLVKGLNAEELLGTEVNGKVIEDCMSRIEAYLWYLVKNGGSSLMGVEYELYDFVTTYNTMNTNLLKAVSSGETMNNVVSDNVVSDVQSVVGYGSIGDKVTEKFQSAILKGNTLMNYYKVERQESNDEQIWGDNELTSVYSKGTYFIKNNTSHKILIGVYTIEPLVYADILYLEGGSHLKVELADDRCLYQFLGKFSDGWTSEDDLSNAVTILQYQDGMENWNIPYFEGMTSIKMPILHTVGKNLFDKVGINANHAYCAKYEWIGSDLHITTNGDQYNSVSFITEIKAGDYTISVSEHTYIKVVNLGDNSVIFEQTLTTKTFKVLNDCKIRIYFFANLSSTSITTKVISNIQLERGTQSTPYEPYKSNILTTPEDLELRGIGDVQDTLDLTTDKLTQRIGEIVLDGSENWGVNNTQATTTNRFILKGVIKSDMTDATLSWYMVDKLPKTKWSDSCQLGITLTSGNIFLYNNSIEYNISALKSWLSQNPITIQYELTTPTIKTVDFSIVDQDGNTVEEVKPFTNGHIITSSATLTSELEYTLVESNKFNIPALESKEYTVQNDGTEFTLNNIKYSHGITEKTFDGGSEKLPTIPNGYSVEGYKSAVLKGNTLVNCIKTKGYAPTTWPIINLENVLVQPNKKYIAILKHLPVDCKWAITNIGESQSTHVPYNKAMYSIFTSPSTTTVALTLHINKGAQTDLTLEELQKVQPMIIDYQDGMENWDIPYFEGMTSVKMPVLTTTGKNLFYIDEKEVSSANGLHQIQNNEVIIENTTYGYYNCSIKNFYLKPNGVYTISYNSEILSGTPYIKVIIMDDQKNTLVDINKGTFTAPSNGKVKINFYSGSSTNMGKVRYYNIQIEEGTVATSYEPYKSNILTTSEEVTLRGIGEVKDELDLLTGEATERICEIVLDGSENWNEDGNLYFTSIDKKVANSTAISNYLQSQNFIDFLGNSELIGISCQDRETYSRIYIRINANYTKEETIQHLQQNPLTVQCVLATESVKTVDFSIVNQDGETLDKLEYFNNGRIFYENEFSPQTTYKANINGFKGIVNVGTVKNNVLTATDKDIMIVEGDKTDCYIPKFKGMVSCTDMCLEIENEDGSTVLIQYPVNKDVVIRKIKDIEDTFNYLTGEYTRRIGEITFDGSENWETSITSNGKFIGIVYIENGELSNIYDDKEYQWNNGYLFCKDPYLGNLNSCWLHKVDNNTTQFRLMLDGTQTLADEFKAYVINNPITIQYALAEPIVTKVDVNLTEDDMRSFEGITKFRVEKNDSMLFPSKTVVTVRTSNDTDLALLNDEISTLSVKQNDTSNTISNTSEDIENVSNGLNEINSLLE